MTFTSILFAGFCLATLIIYHVLPRRAQDYGLLIASYGFLASWDMRFVLIFALLTLANYLLGPLVIKKKERATLWLRVGILVNVAGLAYFKYVDFFVPQMSSLVRTLGFDTNLDSLRLMMPIGLSFFTVQAIAYLLDIRNGVSQPTQNLRIFALYMVYFPRVTAGPIERARDFLPQLENKPRIEPGLINDSLILIVQGLVRKIVVAELLFLLMPTNVFDDVGYFSAPELGLWLAAYSFAVYNDFAGYTNIARGISGLFGIRLSQNFQVPYLARNLTEFWQRWHISFSTWLRDYVFTPISRALFRRKYNTYHPVSIIVPPMVTMFVSALWHNVSWNMLLWGGLHGCYLVLERIHVLRNPGVRLKKLPFWRQVLARLFVFALITLAWVPFRMDLPTTLDYWGKLLSPIAWLNDLPRPVVMDILISIPTMNVILLVGLSLVIDVSQYVWGEQIVQRTPRLVQIAVLNAAAFAIIVATAAQTDSLAPFIYQGF